MNHAFLDGYMAKGAARVTPPAPKDEGTIRGYPGFHEGYLQNTPAIDKTYEAKPGKLFTRLPVISKVNKLSTSQPDGYYLDQKSDLMDEYIKNPAMFDAPVGRYAGLNPETLAANAGRGRKDLEEYITRDLPRIDQWERNVQKEVGDDLTPISSEQAIQFRKGLRPGLKMNPEVRKGIPLGGGALGSFYDDNKDEIHTPPTGRGSDWPILWHEYAHSSDPLVTKTRGVGRHLGSSSEPEIPAMVVENSALRSPHYSKQIPPVGTGKYDPQVNKYGPSFTGNIHEDQNRVNNWMNAIRRQPGAQIPQQNPLAYNRETRTPEKRAEALGTAYQQFMNYQARLAAEQQARTQAHQTLQNTRRAALRKMQGK